ncbi:hypothetical protein JHK82_040187 [Glycine max]|nr:hypothetical protein JHK82_040187 [Glycine max]KAG5122255.1 hypothetical protein JHK84_040595 [Glycine max]
MLRTSLCESSSSTKDWTVRKVVTVAVVKVLPLREIWHLKIRLCVFIQCRIRDVDIANPISPRDWKNSDNQIRRTHFVKLEGDINQDVTLYKKALYYNWRYVDAMYILGVAYGEMLKFDMAIVFYELAFHFNPHCVEACNNLRVIYKDRENLEKAVDCYQLALSIKPNFSLSLNNLNVVYTVQVYEHITYDNLNHISLASFTGRQEQTVITSSLSKSFSVICNGSKLYEPNYTGSF